MNTTIAFCVVLAGVIFTARAEAADRSPDGVWQWADAPAEAVLRGEPWVRPDFYRGVTFDAQAFADLMAAAPMEFTIEARERPVRIDLPMPDGTFQEFDVWESPVMEPGLAAQLPGVKTWAGQGVDDPTATVRMDLTPQGFHSQVLSVEGSFYIDPFTRGDTTYLAVYDSRDHVPVGRADWRCLTDGVPAAIGRARPADLNRSGTFLQNYRLCVAATGEYTAFHGGTVALAQAAIVTVVNRVTGVFEREVAVRFTLIANNTSVVYINAATDPYSDGVPFDMTGQNQANLTTLIGTANYDVGHVFGGLNGGGYAFFGACDASFKARGATSVSSPSGSDFHTYLICHELGHQFGTLHAFNGLNGGCGPNHTPADAYEPGSGNTIMSYAGICGIDNLQSAWDGYYNHESFNDMLAYSTGAGGCPTNVTNGNTVPTVNAGGDFTIPRQTPFILTGSGSDINGDLVSYCWEQRDLGPQQGAVGGVIADLGSGPIIRSFSPVLSPARIIPRLSNLLNNTFVIGEALPNTNRTLNFRLTARDNRAGGGGVNTDDMTVTCTTAAGPFRVTFPNGGGTHQGTVTVTWNVASTNLAPVSCANVKIELSLDGGNTWPTTLLASTPNDGSQSVTIPGFGSSTARLRVMGVGNIFFDISDSNFTLAPPPSPGPFNLMAPADGAANTPLSPVLMWSAAERAQSYTVTIDTEASFALPVTFQVGTGFTSYVVPSKRLAEGTTYFWRVVATNTSGSTTGTPGAASFTTVAPALCDGDADGDGDRDFADITEVLTYFNVNYAPALDGLGDATHDGIVNFADITSVLTFFGIPC